ncbi:MAG TPA: hypothetical protein VE978_05670 [Chitinophagales bacterium]|nr:hypothetical protein [Chitinophagales bacterium]
MRPRFYIRTFTLMMFFTSCGQSQSTGQTNKTTAGEYTNELFLFSAEVPKDWKLFGQIKKRYDKEEGNS